MAKGRPTPRQLLLIPSRVISIGFGVSGEPGPFCLDIEHVAAARVHKTSELFDAESRRLRKDNEKLIDAVYEKLFIERKSMLKLLEQRSDVEKAEIGSSPELRRKQGKVRDRLEQSLGDPWLVCAALSRAQTEGLYVPTESEQRQINVYRKLSQSKMHPIHQKTMFQLTLSDVHKPEDVDTMIETHLDEINQIQMYSLEDRLRGVLRHDESDSNVDAPFSKSAGMFKFEDPK